MTEGLTAQIQTRRPYRSVAFGTWKVGGARDFKTRTMTDQKEVGFRKSSSPSQVYLTRRLQLDRNSRLGESSPNLSRLHHTETQYSLDLPVLSMAHSIDDRLGNRVNDYYSSSEYCQYVSGHHELDSLNGNPTIPEPIHEVLKGNIRQKPLEKTASSRRKSRQQLTTDRNHHRSQSAGPDTVYTVNASTSSGKMGGLARAPISSTDVSGGTTTSNTKFLRATKRFFKKIYTTATLPSKKSTSASSDHLQKQCSVQVPAFFERPDDARLASVDVEDYGSDCEDVQGGVSKATTLDVSYPDSGFEVDSCRASTPDHSVESMTSSSKTSSSSGCDSASTSRQFSMTSPGSSGSGEQFTPFGSLFEQLKKEMTEMRERDAQILADLHRVEEQIQSVRLAQMGYADQSTLVESMPL